VKNYLSEIDIIDMLALLYELEACPLRSSDNNSLHIVINRFVIKLFKTNNVETITYCCMQFNFDLPSTILKKEVMFLLENIVVQ